MERIFISLVFVTLLFLLNMANCVVDDGTWVFSNNEVKKTLIEFLARLLGQENTTTLDWKLDSDPCKDHWKGVYCDSQMLSIKKLYLDRLNFSGTLDVSIICNSQPLAASLTFLNLDENNVSGTIPAEIGNCKQLTRLHVAGNQLTGNLPSSLASLNNLKRLDISDNKFSGPLPELSRISGLNMFLAQNNRLSGSIPAFDFSNFDRFNVSFNNFSGPIPHGHFPADSFVGNPELCGFPLTKNCSNQPLSGNSVTSENDTSKSHDHDQDHDPNSNRDQILMYSGYAALGILLIVLLVSLKFCRKTKTGKKVEAMKGDYVKEHIPSYVSSDASKSEVVSVSTESAMVSLSQQSLVVLSRPVVNELRLEDLLRAPAEMIGRGKNGSLYKVMLSNGVRVVVKRIKDWSISSVEFNQRMQLLSQAKHDHVLPPLAFYCSKQEKLLVYQYQQNGSLFKLLHGTSKTFDWTTRLGIAATIAEALSFMHQELSQHGIPHGNLKSSNILLNNNMEPCISEYGTTIAKAIDDQQNSSSPYGTTPPIASNGFKGDVYGFGVILLELLTGKLGKSNGIDLTEWVQSVVREEWTGEVFDRSLLSEYASEERMVNLLQVAIRCVNSSLEVRPSMNQVALMINTIREDEEKSLIYQV